MHGIGKVLYVLGKRNDRQDTPTNYSGEHNPSKIWKRGKWTGPA